MSGMKAYYLSRAAISAALGAVFAASGSPLWAAATMAGLAFAFFLWAPRGGRYAVQPESGVTALRRDERTQVTNDKAARNGFVVTMLALGGIAVYVGAVGMDAFPVAGIRWLLVVGACTYFASDLWLRRA